MKILLDVVKLVFAVFALFLSALLFERWWQKEEEKEEIKK